MNDFSVLGNDEESQGYIGRDEQMRTLDRAMSQDHAGILIHGPGGVGKTTLVRGFARRLLSEDRISADDLFWFSFEWDIRTAEYVINQLGIELLGIEFVLDSMEKRIERLAEALQQQRCLIVWDHFEVVRGIIDVCLDNGLVLGESTLNFRPPVGRPEFICYAKVNESTENPARFRSEDQQYLFELLKQLQGGKTKLLITSRSEESWLGTHHCFRINLTGFEGEERWQYGRTVLSELGLPADRTDQQLAELLDLTDGHPMAMRIMLPELEDHSAGELCRALATNLKSTEEGAGTCDEKLLATLQFAVQLVPESARPLLALLALHERFLDGDDLEAMAAQSDKALTRAEVDALLQTLTHAGLLESCGGSIYKIHPLLSRYLRRCNFGHSGESWRRAFVDVMANRTSSFVLIKAFIDSEVANDPNSTANTAVPAEFAGSLAAEQLIGHRGHNRRQIPFYFNDLNYQTALALADRLGMDSDFSHLLGWLGTNTQNKRDFDERVRGYRQTADTKPPVDNPEAQAARSDKLGMIAWQQRDFDAAAALCRHALDIAQGMDNENIEATISYALGWVAQQQGDFDAVETWYQKALSIYEKQENEYAAASIYGNLGLLAGKQGQFDAADKWIQRARAVFERRGDQSGVARSYHNLGVLAHIQRDFDTAVERYKQSLTINEAIGNEHDAASTYHSLGVVATEQRDFDAAGEWLRKALESRVKQGNQYDAANTYYWLGSRAYYKRDFDLAERWLQRALEIAKQQDNQSVMAYAHHVLGMIAEVRGDFEGAEGLYGESIRLFEKNHENDVSATYHQLGIIAQRRSDLDAAETWYRKSIEIDERLGNEHGAAISYQNLGVVARQRGDLEASEKWLNKSLHIKQKQGNELGAAYTYHQLGRVAEDQRDFKTAENWYRKAIEINEKHGDELGAAPSYFYLGQIAQARQYIGTAETWYRKAIEIYEKQGDDLGAAFAYRQLSCIAAEQQNYDTAERWFRRVLEVDEKHRKTDNAAWTCYTLGTIAQKHRDFGIARKWFRKSLKFNEHATWWDGLTFCVRSWCHQCLRVFAKGKGEGGRGKGEG